MTTTMYAFALALAAGAVASTEGPTTTAVLPAPQPPIRRNEAILIGAGDIASCDSSGDEATAALVERMLAASDHAVAFTAGDNTYPDGTVAQYERCYEPSWGRFKSRTLPAVGNHDWRTPRAAGMRSAFAGRFTSDSPLWYAADVRGRSDEGAADHDVHWRVVVLDSNCDKVDCTKDGPQYAWLKQELARQRAARIRCTVAIFHHPRFTSGPHGDDLQMSDVWQLLDDGGVDLVVSGHDHVYERFPAMTAKGEVVPGRGIPSLVAGVGGKSHYPTLVQRAQSSFLKNDRDGVVVLRLRQEGWTSALWTTDDAVHDTVEGRCR
jgi:3',5'-cyclic AMP phosphodiesterase CpdA